MKKQVKYTVTISECRLDDHNDADVYRKEVYGDEAKAMGRAVALCAAYREYWTQAWYQVDVDGCVLAQGPVTAPQALSRWIRAAREDRR